MDALDEAALSKEKLKEEMFLKELGFTVVVEALI
jgi:hypothetical protein